MEHSYFQDRLSAYHDNELPLQEKVVVDEHVKACHECQQLLEQYTRLDELVISHGQLGDTDYWERSAKAIDKAIGHQQENKITSVSAVRRKFDLGWKLAAVAATVVIVGYIGIRKDEIFSPEKVLPPASATSVPRPADSKEAIPGDVNAPAPTNGEKTNLSSQDQLKKSDKSSISGGSDDYLAGGRKERRKAEPNGVAGPNLARDLDAQIVQSGDTTLQRAKAAPAAAPPVSDKFEQSVAEPQSVSIAEERESLTPSQRGSVASNVKSEDEVMISDSGKGLVYWRAVRDSFRTTGSGAKDQLAGKFRSTISSSLQKTSHRPQLAASLADTAKSNLRLVKAWYQIGRLTTDSTERAEARAALQVIAQSGSSAIEKDTARAYLDSLGFK